MIDFFQISQEIRKNFPALLELSDSEKDDFWLILKNTLSVEKKSLSTDQLVLLFLDSVKDTYKKVTETAIRQFIEYGREKNFDFFSITQKDIRDFISAEYGAGKSFSSVRVELSRINQFYKFLKQENQLKVVKNPFEKIELGKIDYNSKTEDILPSEEDIQTILSALPRNQAVVFAITVEKGYNLTDLYDLSFGYTEYVIENETSADPITAAFCYTKEDLWSNVPEHEDSRVIVSDSEIPDTSHYGRAGYYEYLTHPAWYNDLLFDFWLNDIISEAPENAADGPGYGELYYSNHEINLHSIDNAIVKKIKALYNEKKISAPYALKNFRWLAIRKIYEKTHDLKKIQKLLKHTTLNTTRRYLKNMGIEVKE